jgi:hypothetical protein
MSSHHFVKEGQEPALFIVDPVDFRLAEPLLEWAPLVMVLDTAVDSVLEWGIKIDIVLVNAGEETAIEEKLLDQLPVQVFSYQLSEGPVTSGIDVLLHQSTTAVNIMMEVESFPFDFADRGLQLNIINQAARWSFISRGVFEKWVSKGTRFDVKLFDHAQLTVAGLDRMEDHYLAQKDGVISIHSSANFWVGQKP